MVETWRASGPAARAPRSCSTPPARPTRSGPAFEVAASAGRLMMVGMSHHDVPLRVFGVRRQGAGRARRELRAGRRVRGGRGASWSATATQLENLITPGVPAGAGARGAPVGDGPPGRGDEGRDRRHQLRRYGRAERAPVLEISGKARRALDAICDTFVPGEDGLPSATELRRARGDADGRRLQPEQGRARAVRRPARRLGHQLAARAELPSRRSPRPSARHAARAGPTRPRSGSAPPSRRSARASC